MNALSATAIVPRPARRSVAPEVRRPALPWTPEQFLRLLSVGGITLTALLVSWFGASGTALPGRTALFTVVGIGGVIVLGLTNAMWLLAGRRAIGERRAQVLSQIQALLPGGHPAEAAAADGTALLTPAVASGDRFVAVAGATRFHRPHCQLALGKELDEASAASHAAAGRIPCGVCQP